MGLTTTDNLPDPLDDGFLHTDPETRNNLLLRPDFTRSFGENSAWHSWLHHYISESGARWDSILTPEFVKQKGEHVILERIKTCFKGFQTRYKQSNKAPVDLSAGRRDGRHKQRKATASSYSSDVATTTRS
jgi:hypothetical protein